MVDLRFSDFSTQESYPAGELSHTATFPYDAGYDWINPMLDSFREEDNPLRINPTNNTDKSDDVS